MYCHMMALAVEPGNVGPLRRFAGMGQQGIEIRYSSDGPYLTFHGGGSRGTYSLARIMSEAAQLGSRGGS
jgi:hypothetical protein